MPFAFDVRYEGLEYDWLAADGDGRVALFTTAGVGLVPLGFDPCVHDAALDAAAECPTTSDVALAPAIRPDHRNLWRELAERGLYGFDASSTRGPFRRVAIPTKPERLEGLPSAVGMVAVLLPDVCFARDELVGEPSHEPPRA